jgi:hypothetical protein
MKQLNQDQLKEKLPKIAAALAQATNSGAAAQTDHYRDQSLKKATLRNCLNAAGERNGHLKDYKGYEPAIYGEIAGAKFHAECVHNRPDRVNIRLENLTQSCAEKVLGMVRLSQPQDNADNI